MNLKPEDTISESQSRTEHVCLQRLLELARRYAKDYEENRTENDNPLLDGFLQGFRLGLAIGEETGRLTFKDSLDPANPMSIMHVMLLAFEMDKAVAGEEYHVRQVCDLYEEAHACAKEIMNGCPE
jgi:flagellar biosynthesis/type III secretory pathway protein FliH